jgi:hypothetical protein
VSLTATEEDEEMLTSLRHDLTLAASETARWREACVVRASLPHLIGLDG